MNAENGRSSLGTVSLVCGIGGIALPILLGLVGFFLHMNALLFFLLLFFLFVGLELAALVTGILARKTPTGKAGLVISSILVVLLLLVPLLLIPLYLFWRSEAKAVTKPPTVVQQFEESKQ
jgi:hypothetical protein